MGVERSWDLGDPEPNGVVCVQDKDGDTWDRHPRLGGWRLRGGTLNIYYWNDVTAWGPVTEVETQ